MPPYLREGTSSHYVVEEKTKQTNKTTVLFLLIREETEVIIKNKSKPINKKLGLRVMWGGESHDPITF